MAKLVIGTNKQVVVPVIAAAGTPELYRVFRSDNGKLTNSITTSFKPLPNYITDIDNYMLYQCYKGTPASVISGTIDLSNLTTISGSSACNKMFEGCTGITSVDLSNLTTISGSSACNKMFEGCTGITSVDLSNLTNVSADFALTTAFKGCTGLTTVDLSNLKVVGGQQSFDATFDGCTNLTTVDLSGVESVYEYGFRYPFQNCSNLQRVYLSDTLSKRNPVNLLANAPIHYCEYADKLEYMTASANFLCSRSKFETANMKKLELITTKVADMFSYNTNLKSAQFPVLTRYNTSAGAQDMFLGCTNANFTDVYFPMLQVFKNAVPFVTTSFPNQLTIHFRKDQQTTIMGTSGAQYNFGGKALVFDLVGTITVNNQNYIYQAKENKSGYKAWQKVGSTITVGGVVYTFDISQITRNTRPVITGPMLYGWTNGSTTVYTDSLNPQVGDYIWTAFNAEQSTTPIDAVDNEYVYTVYNGEDGAQPDVGDTVYSDVSGTTLGTISAVA